MPAPRNDRERTRIYEQAVSLFFERGFTKTAYKDIAEACGTTKSMVQHYFPKKELLAERFFHEKLDEFLSRAKAIMPTDCSQLELLTCVGLLHYDFLLNDSEAALFCRDLLESRSLTNKIIAEEYEWASRFVRDATPDGTDMKAQFLIALGGAYDVMLAARLAGERLGACKVQLAAMLAFWLPMGHSAEEVVSTVVSVSKLTGIA